MSDKRRDFLVRGGVGGLAGILAAGVAPAVAQSMPEIKWRLASSFPRALDTLFGEVDTFTRNVAAATDNKFQIRTSAAGEIVPGPQVLDAVQNHTVEMGHTPNYYYFGKDPTFALDTAVPFGLNARQMNSWMYEGNGLTLMREFFKSYNIISFPAGNTGCQMGGWFRKEVNKIEDFKGLKFRIGGFAGLVFSKLGAVPQQIPGGEVYSALEKGTIEAAEWVGPYDDEKLSFYKTGAKYYYYPGWWEGSAQGSNIINLKAWDSLPKHYQAVINSCSAHLNVTMLAKYDAKNAPALKRLVSLGTQLRPFNAGILEASYKAALEVYAEISAKNPAFKKIYEDMVQFRDEEILWFRVAERSFDDFMAKATQSTKRS